LQIFFLLQDTNMHDGRTKGLNVMIKTLQAISMSKNCASSLRWDFNYKNNLIGQAVMYQA